MTTLQELCEAGQRLLVETRYLEAIASLEQAEAIAWETRDYDTLSRLYMPLQEARRQKRQRAGEGLIRLDIIARSPGEVLDPEEIVRRTPHGQILIAGFADLSPAMTARELAREQQLYLDVFLGTAFHVRGETVVAVLPEPRVLPTGEFAQIDALIAKLPPFSLIFPMSSVPAGMYRGSDVTYAQTMAWWESLHQPYLAAADACVDPLQQMQGYRKTLEIDYAAELPHQKLSSVAKQLAGK